MKVANRRSANLTLVVAFTLVVAMAAMLIGMPFMVDKVGFFSQIKESFINSDASDIISGEIVFWIWGYAILLIALACCIAAVLIVVRVKRRLIFSKITVSIIFFISRGCLLIALISLAVVFYFGICFLIAVASCFLGLCMRVIANVIAEANDIKNENDLTV